MPYKDQSDGYLPTPSRDPSYRQRRRRQAAPRHSTLRATLKWTSDKLRDGVSGGATAVGSGFGG
eukprot:3432251-Pyramimonas_sp.AAC.1